MDDTAPPRNVDEVMAGFGAPTCPVPESRHPDFVTLGPRFDGAFLYASFAHRQQPRKGTPVPYLSHLLGVASIVLTYGGSEDQAIAGLLHDTVEDCGAEHVAPLEELFGPAVLAMVLACTDAVVPAGAGKGEWHGRKRAYLDHLAELPPGDPALLVSCADKVHNAEAILADLGTEGLALWGRFGDKTPEDQLWYYGELAGVFTKGFDSPLARRLQVAVDALAALHHRLAGAG
jgi:hypothetical protein